MWFTQFLLVLALSAAGVLAQQQGGANSFSDRSNLQYLFDRPLERIFYPKGRNGDVIFTLPANYVEGRYQKRVTDLSNRFGGTAGGRTVTVPPANTPTLNMCGQQNSLFRQLPRNEQFSTFIPYHRQMAQALIESLMSIRSYEDFASTAFFCRDRLNPFLFAYAMGVVILHRADTRGQRLPLFAARFPEKFFDRAVFSPAREEVNLVDNAQERVPIEIPLDWTGTNLDPEHRVAYFREDVGINLCHWHWHLVYPFNGPREIVAKDRRGEIFYYFHQQIISRYNFERFSNRLPRVRRFLNWREPMEEGYFPKLDSLISSRVWAPRQAGARLSDVKREDYQIEFDIQDLERWRDRIYEAIHRGNVQRMDGRNQTLDERGGIDLLGNIVEASNISVNPNLYGDMHNLGHVAMGVCHDPDHRHLENFNVMADPGTTMRDPMFYRWHSFVDDIFHEHKRTLPPYTVAQLGYNGVRVVGVQVQSQGASRPDEFNTFWQKSDIDLSRGLDFQPRGSIFVRITHLQHAPFTYRIQVENTGQARMGTVRIFLAPRVDERETALRFEDQRLLFIELDKFRVNMTQGNNTFMRLSNQSSVTIPFERTFRDINEQPSAPGSQQDQFNYCGCGWPQHMLLPKGSVEGFRAELFVMVSNFADDRVDQPNVPNPCSAGHSYCGILGQRFPDNRPMGYPFDRRPRPGAQTLQTFMTPNMIVRPVTIRFNDPTANRFGSTNANRPRTPNNVNGARAPNNANGSRAPNNANRAPPPPGGASRARAPINGAPVRRNRGD